MRASLSRQEEQALEIEALQSIFEGEEFKSISEKESAEKRSSLGCERMRAEASCASAARLSRARAGALQENHVGVALHVTYTDAYPDEPPIWELEDVLGLSDEKLGQLKEKITETIESSIGMAMIYSVTEACQDRTKLSCMSGT
ncbi:EIF2AK4, partial [Symbiodinium sp. CCMP2456]